MRRIVNGQVVEIPTGTDGLVSADDVRAASGIPSDRALILQDPISGNKLMPQNSRFGFPQGAAITDAPTHKRGLIALSSTLQNHIEAISYGCSVDVPDDCSHIIINNVLLPFGYNRTSIPILIQIPPDYPISPPGVGNHRIFMPSALRYNNRKPKDLHENLNFQRNPYWAWWCYERINWNPMSDDLITLLEMIRADMQNPEL